MAPPRKHMLERSRLARLADKAVAKSWMGPNQKPPLEPEFLWAKGSKGFSEADERLLTEIAEIFVRSVDLPRD